MVSPIGPLNGLSLRFCVGANMSNPTHTEVHVQQSLARVMQPLLDRHGSTGTPSSESGTFVPTESIPAQTTRPSSNRISVHLEFHLQTFQSGEAYPTARSDRSAPPRPSISKPPFLHLERLEFHSQTLQTRCEFHSQTFQDGIQKLKKVSSLQQRWLSPLAVRRTS